MPITEQQKPIISQAWTDLLSGKLSPEAALQILTSMMGADGAKNFVEQAMAERQKGTAAGSSWVQPTATPAPVTMGPVTGNEAGYLSENPTAAWNRAYNLPSVGANPFQSWLSGQSGPAYSAYAAKNMADVLGGLPGSSFGSYLGQEDLGAAPQRALSTLQNVRGRGEPEQQNWMSRFQGEDVGGNLSQLFQAALQGRGYASPFARAASRNIPGYQEQWNTQTLGGQRQADTGTLLTYLMKQLGL